MLQPALVFSTNEVLDTKTESRLTSITAGISEDAIDGNIEYVNAWNCSTWTVTSIRFMDATTMAQLRQDTDLSLWTREELKTKIVPPQ